MNCLELFCGTKSIGKCCDQLGWNVVSLDYEKKFNATHTCDILDFDYKQYPKDYFGLIWCSPDCRFYSKLQNTWIGRKKKDGIVCTREIIEENRKYSDTLIYKCWEIIDYFNPELWFVENPLSSLKDREVMKDKPFYIVDYCMYSKFGYRKRTYIWTNKKDWKPKTCDGSGSCGNMITIPTTPNSKHAGYGTPIKSATRTLHISPIGDMNKVNEVRRYKKHNSDTDKKDFFYLMWTRKEAYSKYLGLGLNYDFSSSDLRNIDTSIVTILTAIIPRTKIYHCTTVSISHKNMPHKIRVYGNTPLKKLTFSVAEH